MHQASTDGGSARSDAASASMKATSYRDQ